MRILLLCVASACAASVFAQSGWRMETGAAGWDMRLAHNAVEFQGKLWVFHGTKATLGPQRDAWSTVDGINWVREVEILPWGSRSGAAMLTFGGKLWMLGGQGSGYRNDVWSSPDGVNWTREVQNAPWVGRTSHQVVEFNGRMWIMGGLSFHTPIYSMLNDVWSSADGVNWTMEVAAANWRSRYELTVLNFNGRMWLMGGGDGATSSWSDVWASSDGSNWTLELASAPWQGRGLHTAVVYNNRAWVIAGYSDKRLGDVWSTADGVTWHEHLAHAPFGARYWHDSAVFKDRIWVLGGATKDAGFSNDVWSYGLHFTPVHLPGVVVDVPYNTELQAQEGEGPYTWELAFGSLPPGLSLVDSTSDVLPITGTPTSAGQFNFQIKLTDARGHEYQHGVFLTVAPRPKFPDGGGIPGCTAEPHPHLPLTTAIAAALYALTRRRRLARH